MQMARAAQPSSTAHTNGPENIPSRSCETSFLGATASKNGRMGGGRSLASGLAGNIEREAEAALNRVMRIAHVSIFISSRMGIAFRKAPAPSWLTATNRIASRQHLWFLHLPVL